MKKIILTGLHSIGLLLLSISIIHAQEINFKLDVVSKIDSYLSEGVENGFSGSILIVKNDQIILNNGYGKADKENNISYTPTSVATIGSVTKQFTATAILKLEEFNKLKTTDSISFFFKDIPEDKKDITIHQLLTHSSGLIEAIGEGDFDDMPRDKFLEILFTSELLHQPGTKYAYSNAAYSLLASIVELVSGQEYERFLHNHLFEPAGMTQTGYFIPSWEPHLIAKGYAYGVISVGSMIERYQGMKSIPWTLKGNGGIHSTSGDMYKWCKALSSNKILSKSSFEKLTKPHVSENEAGSSYYGYGWAIYESNRNTKIISHNGGNRIFFHDFIWSPEEDLLIVLFTNGASKEVEVAWRIEKMLFETTYTPEPIRKNLHLLVIDFMQTKSLKDTTVLLDLIKKEYFTAVSHPSILNDLGYDIMRLKSENNIDWAIEIFKLNVELFPEDGNNYDSLGESYLRNGQKDLALKSYRRALDLSPTSNCSWCKSSSNAIKELNKMKN